MHRVNSIHVSESNHVFLPSVQQERLNLLKKTLKEKTQKQTLNMRSYHFTILALKPQFLKSPSVEQKIQTTSWRKQQTHTPELRLVQQSYQKE